ncbi:MAG: UDP binding domain-containing protein, partial [Planctomycetota bacterium]
IERVGYALNKAAKPVRGSKILILGLAYKKDVDDSRESPSFELMRMLLERGASVQYNDPYIPAIPQKRDYPDLPKLQSIPLTEEMLHSMDCVLIATDHSDYDFEFICEHSRLIVDTRNASDHVVSGRDRIWKA